MREKQNKRLYCLPKKSQGLNLVELGLGVCTKKKAKKHKKKLPMSKARTLMRD